MVYVFLVVLLIIVVIFGISSGMQSYATAQQAQAQIEVAKIAQINAWGNLLVILAILAIVVVILALIAALVHLRIRVGAVKREPVRELSVAPLLPTRNQLDMMLYAKLFQMLDPRQDPQQNNLPEMPQEEVDDPFPWLRLE